MTVPANDKRLAWRAFAAAVAPFAVESAYLFFSRWPSYRFTGFSDYVGLGVCVLVGAIFVAMLPIRPRVRVLSLLIYLPLLSVLLFFYCFWFVGVVFDEWL